VTGRWSLKARLVGFLMLFTAGFVLACSVAGFLTIRREINETMDGALQQIAGRMVPVVVEDLAFREGHRVSPMLARSIASKNEPIYFQVRDAQGRVLMHAHDTPAAPLTATLRPGFADELELRVYTEIAANGTLYLQVADSVVHRRGETLEAATGFLLPLLLLLPVSAGVAWCIVYYATRPIARLSAEIEARHGNHLDTIDADLPDELAAISRSVNALMKRLRMALEAEKDFAANCAHELRTPVAGALAQASRLLAEAPDTAVRNRALQIKTALSRLSRLSEKLLQLARADAGIAASEEKTDLGRVATAVALEFRQSGYERRLTIDCPPSGPMVIFDPDALAIVARNLLENAFRHGESDGEVALEVDARARLVVSNSAPPITEEKLEMIRGRLVSTAPPGQGTGLGLAIVGKLVQQAGAKLTLASTLVDGRPIFEATVECRTVEGLA
jgi:two-component system, OmpR family, sensor kinase